MPEMYIAAKWRWWSKATLIVVATALLLAQPSAIEPARHMAREPVIEIQLIHDAPTPLFAIHGELDDFPVVAAPATAPTTAPFLRGLYTGAARTAVNSSGKSRVVWMEVTAYCPCPICCGPNASGVTASGKPVKVNGGAFVAADADRFPFNTKLRIPGYHNGEIVEVLDRGSAILGPRLDVFFPTHEEAAAWGRQWLAVTVEENSKF